MERISKPRQRWSLTEEAFDTLLGRLSPDREEVARQFELHRGYLITLLTYTGAADPEHLADTVLDRTAKRLSGGEVSENLRAWLRGAYGPLNFFLDGATGKTALVRVRTSSGSLALEDRAPQC